MDKSVLYQAIAEKEGCRFEPHCDNSFVFDDPKGYPELVSIDSMFRRLIEKYKLQVTWDADLNCWECAYWEDAELNPSWVNDKDLITAVFMAALECE